MRKQLFFEYFEGIAKTYFTKKAIVFKEQSLTYGELNERANQLAHSLSERIKKSDSGEEVIGVRLDPSIEAIIAFIGIMKAGLVYLPIPTDTDIAEEKLQQIIHEAQPVFIIDRSNIQDLLKHKKTQNLGLEIRSDHLAYIAYSSGTTGKPKGVETEHKGLYAVMKSHHKMMQMSDNDCVLQLASLGFDASIIEIIATLGIGATLCVVPMEFRGNVIRFTEYCKKNRVTRAIMTPTMLQAIAKEPIPDTLKLIVSMGEALPEKVLEEYLMKGVTILVGYGVTEATIASSLGVAEAEKKIHAGLAFEGVSFFIFQQGMLQEEGEGELCIAGEGLARGYVKNPELTSKKFVTLIDPVSKAKIRVYKTGDFAKLQKGEPLILLGRQDGQVKIYGKLIQPEAINEILERNPNVKVASVKIELNNFGHPKITAYLILKEGVRPEDVSLHDLYDQVQKGLSRTAAPTRYQFISDIKGNNHAKLDKAQLMREPGEIRMIRPDFLSESIYADESDEQKLSQIWKDILDLPVNFKIEMKDDFFHLGGTSVLIMSLPRKIFEEFHVKISVDALSRNTKFLGMLKKILGAKRGFDISSIIVPISESFPVPAGVSEYGPPIFFVHTLISDCVSDYHTLGSKWNFDKPIYGINPVGLQGMKFADDSIEEAAQNYVAALMKVQPQGPYLLAGWSLGGVLAYEMAQQLRLKNQRVSVTLIDSPAPTFFQEADVQTFMSYVIDLFGKLKNIFSLTSHFDFNQCIGLDKSKVIERVFASLLDKADSEKTKFRLWSIQNFMTAQLQYKAKPGDFDMSFIVAKKSIAEYGGERLCWPASVVFQEYRILDGMDHVSICTNPGHCQTLIEMLREMSERQEAKLFLAPLIVEVTQKYTKNISDSSQAIREFFERQNLFNPMPARKMLWLGSEGFSEEVTSLLCKRWIEKLSPKRFDLLLVIDGRNLSETAYQHEVSLSHIILNECVGRDNFGEKLERVLIAKYLSGLKTSLLILVKNFDLITHDACKQAIMDALGREGVSIILTSKSELKNIQRVRLEKSIFDNYVPLSGEAVLEDFVPGKASTAEGMLKQGLFSAVLNTHFEQPLDLKVANLRGNALIDKVEGAGSVKVLAKESALVSNSVVKGPVAVVACDPSDAEEMQLLRELGYL